MPGLSRMQTTSVFVGVVFVREGDYIVAYCPALELSAYGKTEAEAKKAFEETLEIFIQEITRKGSLDRVLRKLGWVPYMQSYQPPALPEQKLWEMYQNNSGLAVRKTPVAIPQLSMS